MKTELKQKTKLKELKREVKIARMHLSSDDKENDKPAVLEKHPIHPLDMFKHTDKICDDLLKDSLKNNDVFYIKHKNKSL